jgi:Arf-GAP/Rho-GAP domain/ANK repeat/PH domain-containing protein 2
MSLTFNTFHHFLQESGNSLAEQQLTSENVPIIVEKCLGFVAAHGMQLQGIYRLNGTHSKINKLLQDFHNGKVYK